MRSCTRITATAAGTTSRPGHGDDGKLARDDDELALTKWPRRFAYPAAGLLLSLAMIAGLLTVEASTSRHVPTISWIFAELQTRPLAYAYLLVATLMMMSLLGWMVGRKEDLLGRLSTTDPLTGLANRRRLRSAFADELNRAARYETPLSLLLVDLDRLKDINDRHGHGDGDRALQLVAEALRRTCRATDLAARYGGDEFVVLAVNTPATEARVLALRIRDSVRRLSLRAGRWSKTSEPINHTVSIGAADLKAAALPTFDALHAAADRALYAAKSAGRDGVMVAPARACAGGRRRMRRRPERRHRHPQTTRRPMTLTSVLRRARLAEVVVPQAVVGGELVGVVPGDHDQRDAARAHIGPQLARRLASIQPGQAHVHHDDVRANPYRLDLWRRFHRPPP